MATFTPEERQALKDQICEQIAEGINLREICRQDGFPSWRTVYDWMYEDKAFDAAIGRAREVGYHAIAAHTLEIVDEEPERDPQTGKIDPAAVAHQKLRAEHRLKLLAKWSPKLYGDKIIQDHTSSDGSMTPSPALDASKLSTSALKELMDAADAANKG